MVYETEFAGLAVGKEVVQKLSDELIWKQKVYLSLRTENSLIRQIKGHTAERRVGRGKAPAMLQHGGVDKKLGCMIRHTKAFVL